MKKEIKMKDGSYPTPQPTRRGDLAAKRCSMPVKKISLVSSAFTFSDSSRVNWKPTNEFHFHRRFWLISISIPAPLGGYLTSDIKMLAMFPSSPQSIALIKELKLNRNGR